MGGGGATGGGSEGIARIVGPEFRGKRSCNSGWELLRTSADKERSWSVSVEVQVRKTGTVVVGAVSLRRGDDGNPEERGDGCSWAQEATCVMQNGREWGDGQLFG